MAESVVSKAFSVSDSIFLVLLVGLAFGTWGIIRYVFRKNDEREKRYIEVIDTQAKGLGAIETIQTDIREIKYYMGKGGK